MKFEKMLEIAMEASKEAHKNEKVIKSLPVPKKFKTLETEMNKLADEGIKTTEKLKNLTDEMKLIRSNFWSSVRLDNPELRNVSHLQYNRETGEIEVLESKEDDDDED